MFWIIHTNDYQDMHTLWEIACSGKYLIPLLLMATDRLLEILGHYSNQMLDNWFKSHKILLSFPDLQDSC